MAKNTSGMSVELPLFIADAFTRQPFSGNAAAVCLVPFEQDIPTSIMQKMAAEMNLSETAFVKINEIGNTFQDGKQFGLRWLTPVCEVPLCGHATLASSAVLFSEYVGNKSDVITFSTLSGDLKVKKLSDNRIEMDLPAYQLETVVEKYENIVKSIVGNLPVEDLVLSNSILQIRLKDHVTREEFEAFKVSESKVMSHETDIVGVIVTVKASGDCVDEEGSKYDFLSRYFAPWMGILEDPVTGSAHCVLGPYWAKVLKKKTLYARQCSRRGGEINLTLVEDRVILQGNAVVVVKGQIRF